MHDPIRKWFADHDDGEFTIPPVGSPYSVAQAASASHCVVYCTKPRLLLTRLGQGFAAPLAVIGRSGLPNDYDVAWLESFVANRRFVFLGDADPVDLLIFAWLRSRLEISFAGLNDSLLDECRVELSERSAIPLSSAEIAGISLLREELPEAATLLGSRCAATLEFGHKYELEALFSFSTREPEHIFRAIAA